MATSLGVGKPIKFCLKIDCVSNPACAHRFIYIYIYIYIVVALDYSGGLQFGKIFIIMEFMCLPVTETTSPPTSW